MKIDLTYFYRALASIRRLEDRLDNQGVTSSLAACTSMIESNLERDVASLIGGAGVNIANLESIAEKLLAKSEDES